MGVSPWCVCVCVCAREEALMQLFGVLVARTVAY